MKPNRLCSLRRAASARLSGGQNQHVVVAGAGGNIGSHLVPLLARLPMIGRLTLVDGDRYTEQNRRSQAISSFDVGKPKAWVQARLARRINAKLEVLAVVERLENVPLGTLRSNLMLACVDSKESRRQANEIAWRLGTPWIDAGVEASLMLARVNVYLPAKDQPCLECAWSESDYADLAVVHPCDPGGATPSPTSAPACLGALAAAFQALECRKLLLGQSADALIGRQVLIDARTHRHFVTLFACNPDCRFDHALWKITRLRKSPRELSIGSLLRRTGSGNRLVALAFGGRPLVKRLHCPRCGFTREAFRLQHRLRSEERLCARCHTIMLSAGFHMKTRLTRADLGPEDASRSLAELGLRAGDVVSLSDGASERFFQLGDGDESLVRKRKPTQSRAS